MTMLFIFCDPDLLLIKAQYKTITVPGHLHSGAWVSPYQKKVLVADTHDDAKVAAGQGTHYQKVMHKKLAQTVHNWNNLLQADQAALVLAHATDAQVEATSSAAVSDFKAAMLVGKVPSPSQYTAMQAASSDKQAKVVAEIVGKIGEDQYNQLLSAAGAKASKFEAKKTAKKAAPATPHPTGGAAGAEALHVIPSSDPKAGYEVHVNTSKSASGSRFSVGIKDVDSGELLPAVNMFPTEAAALDHAFALADGKKPVAPPAPAPVASSPTAHLSAQQLKNLQSLSWDKLLLPSSNTNAKSHNAIVGKTKTMAFAGDVAGLQAVVNAKAGAKQTYAKQQHKLAQTAIAALNEGEADDKGAVAASAPAAPESNSAEFDGIKTPEKPEQHQNKEEAKLIAEIAALGWKVQKDADHGLLLAGNYNFANAIHITKILMDNGISASVINGDPQYFVQIQGLVRKDGKQKTPQPAGPQEGDTKQGAEGMLVLKNGHWVKVDDDSKNANEPASPAPQPQPETPASLPEPPQFSSLHGVAAWALNYAQVANWLKNEVQNKGLDAFKGVVINHADGEFTIKTPKFTLKKVGPNDKTAYRVQMHAYVTELKAWAAAQQKKSGKKPAASAKPKTTPATVSVQSGVPVTDMAGWVQTGKQQGSNPGGRFQDPSGQQWYCKFPDDPDMVRSELLAAKFYETLGIKVPSLKLVQQGGKLGIASNWQDGLKKGSHADLAAAPGSHAGFVVDAWLANWDVVGLASDNLLLGKDGSATRVDVGGSLLYRAMGGKKGADFGDTVPELQTLLNPAKNSNSAAVFGGVTPASMAFGLEQLNKLKPSQIEELCEKAAPGSKADKLALAGKLAARRAFILQHFGVHDQWDEKPPDLMALKVKKTELPAPIDFANYNGPGQGLSSKALVNANNTADSAALIEFARKGNLQALKDYQYDAVDKQSGASLGKKPITDHPSSKIQKQWADLVQKLQSIAYPEKPMLALASLGDFGGSLAELDEKAKPFDPKQSVETVPAEHKIGYFMVIGAVGEDVVNTLKNSAKWVWLTKASPFIASLKSAYKNASSLTQKYISAVQANGVVNRIWSQGKKDWNGHNPTQVAASVYADAIDAPEGLQLWRWMGDETAGQSMTKAFLASKPGMILQNTDSMCTSFNESWGEKPHFDSQVKMRIRCAKGVKLTPTFGSGGYGSEGELTTVPGQRFVVLGIQKQGNSGVYLDLLALPPQAGYVAQLNDKAFYKAIIFFTADPKQWLLKTTPTHMPQPPLRPSCFRVSSKTPRLLPIWVTPTR